MVQLHLGCYIAQRFRQLRTILIIALRLSFETFQLLQQKQYKRTKFIEAHLSKIEAKVLYIIQLWYDAFIMYQQEFGYLVWLYKLLKQQNVTFPPRQQHEKNMISVGLQSPIFDNLPAIAENDKQQFQKKKKAVASLQISEQIHEQYKLKCLENTEASSTSKILAPVYQQPAYIIQPERLRQFIDLAQELRCQPLKADFACQQLELFLDAKYNGNKQSEEESLVLDQLRQDAEKVVAQWKANYKEFHEQQEKVVDGEVEKL